MNNVEELATLFGALADPTRLKLLKLLQRQSRRDALCVNALAHRLGVTQSAVSQHLKVLKHAGMVKGEKRGYRVHYFLSTEGLKSCLELATAVLSADNAIQAETEKSETIADHDKQRN